MPFKMTACVAQHHLSTIMAVFTVFDLIYSILDVHAPLRAQKSITKHAPSSLISRYITSLHKRDRARKGAENDRLKWLEYKRFRSRVTSEFLKTVENYFPPTHEYLIFAEVHCL